MATPSSSPGPVLMISVSGVRGLIGQTLTPQVATEFGQAFGHFLKTQGSGVGGQGSGRPALAPLTPRPCVAIGRDTRPSGPMVHAAITAGLLSVGVDVIDLGVATTPSIALMGRFLKSSASIVITASHNPIIWNGIKFVRHDGIAFPPDQAAQIKQLYLEVRNGRFAPPLADMDHLGRFSTDSRAHANHVQTVLQYFDARGIAEKRFRVVLDSVNGAGCAGTPMLLGKLGAELIHMNAEGTGLFAHTPEPTRENLTTLCDEVRRKKAAVGFAQDPDADRLAIVDENGTYIGEEYTLALGALARMMVKPGAAVTNLSTSRMIDDIAGRFGQKVYRTPVGEANVAGKMTEVGAVIGGEGNGGLIDLRVGPVRDSFLGIAMILDLMTCTGKTVSQLVAEIPRYTMIKTKFDCTPEQSAALVAKVKAEFGGKGGVAVDTQDGVRLDTPEGWVHVRQSNTEPIARIIAEARDEAAANALIRQAQALR